MDFIDLKRIVVNNDNIPKDSYSLEGGLPNEALCIEHNNRQWRVYYSERGNKSNLKMFQSETNACEYFYQSLIKMLGIN